MKNVNLKNIMVFSVTGDLKLFHGPESLEHVFFFTFYSSHFKGGTIVVLQKHLIRFMTICVLQIA